ncbi:MAG TPA: M15 family metallopeptidase [Anaeromyxobacteraceae bacterium]
MPGSVLAALALAAAPPLVDAAAVVPGAVLDLRYATARNVTGRPLYPAARCLLLGTVAERLARAEADLEARGFRLLLWDCYRPPSAQAALWRALPDPRWVADPARGSNHGRGAAVDVSLVRLDGSPVEMPTDHDAFVARARPAAVAGIGAAALAHRELLAASMRRAGFVPGRGEWWHFDEPRARALPLLDVPLEGPP